MATQERIWRPPLIPSLQESKSTLQSQPPISFTQKRFLRSASCDVLSLRRTSSSGYTDRTCNDIPRQSCYFPKLPPVAKLTPHRSIKPTQFGCFVPPQRENTKQSLVQELTPFGMCRKKSFPPMANVKPCFRRLSRELLQESIHGLDVTDVNPSQSELQEKRRFASPLTRTMNQPIQRKSRFLDSKPFQQSKAKSRLSISKQQSNRLPDIGFSRQPAKALPDSALAVIGVRIANPTSFDVGLNRSLSKHPHSFSHLSSGEREVPNLRQHDYAFREKNFRARKLKESSQKETFNSQSRNSPDEHSGSQPQKSTNSEYKCDQSGSRLFASKESIKVNSRTGSMQKSTVLTPVSHCRRHRSCSLPIKEQTHFGKTEKFTKPNINRVRSLFIDDFEKNLPVFKIDLSLSGKARKKEFQVSNSSGKRSHVTEIGPDANVAFQKNEDPVELLNPILDIQEENLLITSAASQKSTTNNAFIKEGHSKTNIQDRIIHGGEASFMSLECLAVEEQRSRGIPKETCLQDTKAIVRNQKHGSSTNNIELSKETSIDKRVSKECLDVTMLGKTLTSNSTTVKMKSNHARKGMLLTQPNGKVQSITCTTRPLNAVSRENDCDDQVLPVEEQHSIEVSSISRIQQSIVMKDIESKFSSSSFARRRRTVKRKKELLNESYSTGNILSDKTETSHNIERTLQNPLCHQPKQLNFNGAYSESRLSSFSTVRSPLKKVYGLTDLINHISPRAELNNSSRRKTEEISEKGFNNSQLLMWQNDDALGSNVMPSNRLATKRRTTMFLVGDSPYRAVRCPIEYKKDEPSFNESDYRRGAFPDADQSLPFSLSLSLPLSQKNATLSESDDGHQIEPEQAQNQLRDTRLSRDMSVKISNLHVSPRKSISSHNSCDCIRDEAIPSTSDAPRQSVSPGLGSIIASAPMVGKNTIMLQQTVSETDHSVAIEVSESTDGTLTVWLINSLRYPWTAKSLGLISIATALVSSQNTNSHDILSSHHTYIGDSILAGPIYKTSSKDKNKNLVLSEQAREEILHYYLNSVAGSNFRQPTEPIANCNSLLRGLAERRDLKDESPCHRQSADHSKCALGNTPPPPKSSRDFLTVDSPQIENSKTRTQIKTPMSICSQGSGVDTTANRETKSLAAATAAGCQYLNFDELPPPPLGISKRAIKRSVLDNLSSSEEKWRLQFDALTRLQSLAKHVPLFLHQELLGDILEQVVKACSSLRSGVSKNGILTLTTIAKCLPGGLDSYVELMIPVLLSRTAAVGQKFIATSAMECLEILCSKGNASIVTLQALCNINIKRSHLMKLCLESILNGFKKKAFLRIESNEKKDSAKRSNDRIEDISEYRWVDHISHLEFKNDLAQQDMESVIFQAGTLLMHQIVLLLDDRSVVTKRTTKEILEMLINSFKLEWKQGMIRKKISDVTKNTMKNCINEDLLSSPSREENITMQDTLVFWAQHELKEEKQKIRIVKEIKAILLKQSTT